ncbi:MAG TPA: class I SAM-dependent methyltransferase [Gaiellaceae bacterium]|nr:class I SAM-dependent methyltransferase [Gaiellaceae bacterium]
MTPPLVERAARLAAELGFANSCTPETGRLLHLLAAMRGRTRVAETGTGVGYGAAWIVSALEPAVPFFTAELDDARAAAAAELFRQDENVHVLAGDWHDVLPEHAPFDLLFHDGSKRRPDLDGEETRRLLAPRGLVVLDDMTPGRDGPDPVRDFWLDHPDLAATEVQLSLREAVILAVRVR